MYTLLRPNDQCSPSFFGGWAATGSLVRVISPLFVQPERHDRLIDREDVLGGLAGTIEKIGLVAQPQSDPPGDRVLDLLGDFGVALRCRRLRQGPADRQRSESEDDLRLHAIERAGAAHANRVQ